MEFPQTVVELEVGMDLGKGPRVNGEGGDLPLAVKQAKPGNRRLADFALAVVDGDVAGGGDWSGGCIPRGNRRCGRHDGFWWSRHGGRERADCFRSQAVRARDFDQSNLDRRYAYVMRPLRYYINVTLDGCCDHREMFANEDLHRHAAEILDRADALLFGRVTYEMMEAAWRPPARTGAKPDWMEPFARTIDAAKKYVVSSTLDRVDWNAELVRGDLGKAVQQLKRESGKGLLVGGVKLPLALAELGLIDEYEFVVHPRLAGHGPTLFAGLSKHVDLRLVNRLEFGSGAVAMRYEPRR